MALKADRICNDSMIDWFMNETAERGGIVVISTTGSGIAMDQAKQLCTYNPTDSNSLAGSMSGCRPLGVLMNDVVNLDLTRQHMNWHKDEVQQGGKVTIWNRCTVVTNRIYPGTTPAEGNPAWVAHSGYIAPTDVTASTDTGLEGATRRLVGAFMSTLDEDGYCKVAINLP